jgi:hypothetical protein
LIGLSRIGTVITLSEHFMRSLLCLPLLAAALSSCGPKTLALPADPIDRAATCGVVAAAAARAGSAAIDAPLDFEDQGRIMHYAMLAGAEGDRFAKDKAAAVVERMPQLEASITGEKWNTLIEPCEAAYPGTRPSADIKLPSDPLQSQMSCYMLSDFLTTALRSQEPDYRDQIVRYDAMERTLYARIGRTVAAQGGLDYDGMQNARNEAMAVAVKLGPPMAVMDQCLDRYG